MLDAYCRHMGGDLTRARSRATRSPARSTTGAGAATAGARRSPTRGGCRPPARTRSWRTLEQNKQLFVWHDPQGNPPPADVTIPRIEGAYSDEWSDWTWDSILIEGANCREIIDNVVDMAHFFYIHFAFPTYFKNVFEGHIASQYLKTRARPDVEPAADNSGGNEHPALGGLLLRAVLHDRLPVARLPRHDHRDHADQLPLPGHADVVHAAVGRDRQAAAGPPRRRRPTEFAAKFAKFIGLGFEQDVEIWQHKTRIDNPLLCAEDGAGVPVAPLVRAVLRGRRRRRRRTWWPGTSSRWTPPARCRAGRPRSRRTWPQAGQAIDGAGPRQPGRRRSPRRADPRRPRVRGRRPARVPVRSGAHRCGAAVRVAKFSPQHTIVQWTAESVRACAEFARPAAAGGRRP